MKYVLGFLLACSLNVSAMMLDIDGLPRTEPYSIIDITMHCDAKGYFIYGGTIYMCVKIREGVSKAELRAYTTADNKLQAEKRAADEKWFKEWSNTTKGKAWLKKWNEEHPLKTTKDHK